MKDQTITPSLLSDLRENLSYDPETGLFTWLSRPALCVRPGDKAGCASAAGYVQIRLMGVTYRAHRLAFALMLGRWPVGFVDHINRIRDDNRWENLREVSVQENGMNRGLNENNTSGRTGVAFNKKHQTYVAYISRQHLGSFKTLEEAVRAREAAEIN